MYFIIIVESLQHTKFYTYVNLQKKKRDEKKSELYNSQILDLTYKYIIIIKFIICIISMLISKFIDIIISPPNQYNGTCHFTG